MPAGWATVGRLGRRFRTEAVRLQIAALPGISASSQTWQTGAAKRVGWSLASGPTQPTRLFRHSNMPVMRGAMPRWLRAMRLAKAFRGFWALARSRWDRATAGRGLWHQPDSTIERWRACPNGDQFWSRPAFRRLSR